MCNQKLKNFSVERLKRRKAEFSLKLFAPESLDGFNFIV
jgi:hypothetical protein